MKKNEKTVAEVLLPASVDNIPASTGNMWTPKNPIKAETPVLISFEARKREIGEGAEKKTIEDVVLVFMVAGITCKTYASVLKGQFERIAGVGASPFKAKGNGRVFIDRLTIGYEENKGASKDRFPVNMYLGQR